MYGENEYLFMKYEEQIVQALDAKESMMTLYFDEYEYQRAKEFLSQSSLFGGINLLVIKHDKKVPKKEIDELVGICVKNSNAYLLYIYYGSAKDARSLQNSFGQKSGGVWVRFFELSLKDATLTLKSKSEQLGVQIDEYALQHLLLVLNNDLALAANELKKLSILQGVVTSKDIDRLVYSTAPLAIEQFLNDLFNKKPITESLQKLLEMGEDEFAILRSTQYFVQQIFLFNAYIKLNGRVDSSQILGYKLPKAIEETKARLATKIGSAALLKIYQQIIEYELKIKKAPATQKEVLLYGMFIKIQSFL